jgi:hypothetical protein
MHLASTVLYLQQQNCIRYVTKLYVGVHLLYFYRQSKYVET